MSDAAPDAMAGLSEEERERVAFLLIEKQLTDGQVLLTEGEPASGLFLLREGWVSVFKYDMGGQPRLICELNAPAMVGELELLTGEVCTATVKAKGTATASILPATIFEKMLEDREAAAIKLMRNLARGLGQKLNASNEVYVDLAIWR